MTIQQVRVKLVDLISAVNELAEQDDRYVALAEEGEGALAGFDEEFPEATAPSATAAVNHLEA